MGRGRQDGSSSSRGHEQSCRTLQRVYAQPLTLADAVGHLAQGVDGIRTLLTRPGDTAAYTDQFLTRTVVAFESTPPVRQQAWRLSQRFSQEQVGETAGAAAAAVRLCWLLKMQDSGPYQEYLACWQSCCRRDRWLSCPTGAP